LGINLAKEARRMRTKLFAGAILLAFVTPASAQTFYIVQDTGTKRCTIVEQRPTVQTSVVVGGDRVYTTRAEAETAMRTVEVCKTN
jgi:hypothetical protein